MGKSSHLHRLLCLLDQEHDAAGQFDFDLLERVRKQRSSVWGDLTEVGFSPSELIEIKERVARNQRRLSSSAQGISMALRKVSAIAEAGSLPNYGRDGVRLESSAQPARIDRRA